MKLSDIAKKHKQLLLGFAIIVCILCMPIVVPSFSTEENPDDSTALLLSNDSPIEIDILEISKQGTAIAFWTNTSIKTPLSTILEIQVQNSNTQYVPLKDILTDKRKITIPLQRNISSPLHITLSAPTLENKKALIFRTTQHDPRQASYTVYERRLFITTLLQKIYSHNSVGDDIEYVWREGAGILEGGNPYEKAAKIAHGSDKYATYFSLSYIVSAIIQQAGFDSFESWLTVVRPIILLSQLATACLVFVYLYKKEYLVLGLVGFFIILFHRFTLYPGRIFQVDFPSIMFLVLGMMLLPQKWKTGYLLIGISIAIKQMSIIAIPIFLIWEFKKQKSIRASVIALLLILAIPCITLLPFVLDSPIGVRNSLAFSANRVAGGDFTSPDITTMLSLTGSLSRIGMYGLIALIFAAFWKKEVGMYGAILAIFTIFIGFNPVLFFHYLAWIVPFIPLALSEATSSRALSHVSHQA